MKGYYQTSEEGWTNSSLGSIPGTKKTKWFTGPGCMLNLFSFVPLEMSYVMFLEWSCSTSSCMIPGKNIRWWGNGFPQWVEDCSMWNIGGFLSVIRLIRFQTLCHGIMGCMRAPDKKGRGGHSGMSPGSRLPSCTSARVVTRLSVLDKSGDGLEKPLIWLNFRLTVGKSKTQRWGGFAPGSHSSW